MVERHGEMGGASAWGWCLVNLWVGGEGGGLGGGEMGGAQCLGRCLVQLGVKVGCLVEGW